MTAKHLGQHSLELELPKKVNKKRKGYYLPLGVINYIKSESDRLTTEDDLVSENDVLTAIVRCYQKTAAIKGEGEVAYDDSAK